MKLEEWKRTGIERALIEGELKAPGIAEAYGVSTRTVYKIKEEIKEKEIKNGNNV